MYHNFTLSLFFTLRTNGSSTMKNMFRHFYTFLSSCHYHYVRRKYHVRACCQAKLGCEQTVLEVKNKAGFSKFDVASRTIQYTVRVKTRLWIFVDKWISNSYFRSNNSNLELRISNSFMCALCHTYHSIHVLSYVLILTVKRLNTYLIGYSNY